MTGLAWPWRRPVTLMWRGVSRSGPRPRVHTITDDERRLLAERERLRVMWRAAAIGAGITRQVQVVSGPTDVVPPLERVLPDGALVVRLLEGQLPEVVRAAGPRLAPWLDAAVVRVESRGPHHVVIRRLAVDPLAEVQDLPPAPAASSSSAQVTGALENGRARAADPSFVAYAEDGATLAVPLQSRPHAVVQGTTGSGKSVWTYGALADAAGRPDVLVTGLDPTGLLWRPFAGTRHAPWQVSGLSADMAAHVALLERLVAEMDRRIAGLPDDQDNLCADEDQPILLVVLEEWAGVLRSADAVSRDVGKRVRALVARLLAEGRKAGVRVLLIVQRADAQTVGAFERGQCAMRLSFAVDTPSAVELLHPGTDDAAGHVGAPPGVALVTLPGRPLLRVRAGLLAGGYAEYRQRVVQACPPAPRPADEGEAP